jgi:hypothetical protein
MLHKLSVVLCSVVIFLMLIAPMGVAQPPLRLPEPVRIVSPQFQNARPASFQMGNALPSVSGGLEPGMHRVNTDHRKGKSFSEREGRSLTELLGAPKAIFTVNHFGDTNSADINPGDGICADILGDCGLRTAVMEANADAGYDQIIIPPATVNLTTEGIDEDAAATGDLDIFTNMTIAGAGALQTTINGNGIDRVFDVFGGALVDFLDLGITGGDATLSSSGLLHLLGGGIYVDCAGDLLLRKVNVFNNKAAYAGGVMIYGDSTETCNTSDTNFYLYSSAIFNNIATSEIGGINVFGFSSAIVGDSTISANFAPSYGGFFVDSGATVSINRASIVDNISTINSVSGAGFAVDAGATAALSASIIAYNRFEITLLDCGSVNGGSYTSLGDNVYTSSADCVITGTDVLDPQLGISGIGFYAPGQTVTHYVGQNQSPIDLEGDTCDGTDQRGIPRPQGVNCDSGAYERMVDGVLPGDFNLVSPPTAVTITVPPVELTWGEAAGATNYSLSMSKNGTLLYNAQLMTAASDSDTLTCTDGVCSYTFTEQQSDLAAEAGVYEWSVTAANGMFETVNALNNPFFYILLEPTPDVTPTASVGTELLSNGGFEARDAAEKPILSPWTIKNATGDKIKCNKDKDGDGTLDKIYANNGDCGFVFKGGAGENSKIQQNGNLSSITPAAGDGLNVQMFLNTSVSVDGKIKVVVKYTDGTTKSKITEAIEATTGYQSVGGNTTLASAAVEKIKVSIGFKGTSGKVLLDDVSLVYSSAAPRIPLP